MKTKTPIYKSSVYAALVENRVVPDEGARYTTIREAERVARQHAQPGDVIEVFDVTHQASIIVTRVRRPQQVA